MSFSMASSFESTSPPPDIGFPNAPATAHGSARFLSLVQDTDRFLREIKPPSESNLSFEAFGIHFKARHVPGNSHSTLAIWGTLGYLPYSVNSHKKRNELISILEATHRLRHVKFGVSPHMKIIVTGTFKISKPPTPDYIFVPLIHFLGESMPFIRLIGEYL